MTPCIAVVLFRKISLTLFSHWIRFSTVYTDVNNTCFLEIWRSAISWNIRESLFRSLKKTPILFSEHRLLGMKMRRLCPLKWFVLQHHQRSYFKWSADLQDDRFEGRLILELVHSIYRCFPLPPCIFFFSPSVCSSLKHEEFLPDDFYSWTV